MVSRVEPWCAMALPNSYLKAYLAIATSRPTRNLTLAPRNDKFFKRWPVGVIAAASGENKTEQGWVVRQRHQGFVHCRLIKRQGSPGQRFAACGSVLFCGEKACGQRGICDDGGAFGYFGATK